MLYVEFSSFFHGKDFYKIKDVAKLFIQHLLETQTFMSCSV